MSYLNPPYPSNFEEICACYPLWYMDVREMVAVFQAEGRLLDGVCAGIENTVLNNFIKTADEATIKEWEKATKIRPDPTSSLDDRKNTIIGHFCGRGHIGAPEIIEITAAFVEADVLVEFAAGVITVTVRCDRWQPALPDSYYDILLERIPAHLRLVVAYARTWDEITARVTASGGLGMHYTVTDLPELTFPFDFSTDVPVYPMFTHYSESRLTTEED